MAIMVEDGSVVIGANAYASVEFVDEYQSDRMNEVWSNTPIEQKEAAIVKATTYLDMFYGARLLGMRESSEQYLYWPRIGVVDEFGNTIEGVPIRVKRAVAELAPDALSTALLADLARGGRVSATSVGPVSIQYEKGAPSITRRPRIDALMQPFLIGMYGVRVTRS
jgi:hypothetical protein